MYSRLAFKSLSTALTLLVSILLGFVLPRLLGPTVYGEYTFILATMILLSEVFTAQTSVGYVHLLSRKGADVGGINSLYLRFLTVAAILLIIAVWTSLSITESRDSLWGNVTNDEFVYWALAIAVTGIFMRMATDYADATRQTVTVEAGRMGTSLLMVLGLLFWFLPANDHRLTDFYLLSLVSLLPFIMLAVTRLRFSLSSEGSLKPIAQRLYVYLRPLILLAILASVSTYSGRYVVQYGHSIEEYGYFAFSMAVVMIPVTLISAMTSIYLSEMTQAHDAGDKEDIRHFFLMSCERVFTVHACYAVFLLINVETLVLVVVGEAFLPAVPVIQILTFYSLINTLSVLSGNTYFSTGRTTEYTKVSFTVILIALFVYSASLFVKPVDATSLALLMTAFLFIRMFILLEKNARYFDFSLAAFMGRGLLIFIAIATVLGLINLLIDNVFMNIAIAVVAFVTLNFLTGDFIDLRALIREKKLTHG